MSKGTTHRTVRIDDVTWARAQAQADAEGWDGVSEVIRWLVLEWLKPVPRTTTDDT